jgi:pimeloyl-ACP methyl ester carboxylesterase
VSVIDDGPSSRPEPGLPGFVHRVETVSGVRLHYVRCGKAVNGTIVLLAGFPESWYAWRKVMPILAAEYEVLALDLPGQGDSDRPLNGYDTASLAATAHGLLYQLGIRRYFLAGHDVGAWVAFPFVAHHGDEIPRFALLDAGIPGVTLPAALPTTPERAWRTWHFSFHAIPDLPEVLITGREREYLTWFLRRKTADPASFTDADLDEYLRTFSASGGLRAGLAFYRAADLSAQQNQAILGRGVLTTPLLALSADQGSILDMAEPLRNSVEHVEGCVIGHCGHFMPEEQPAAVAGELMNFFGG